MNRVAIGYGVLLIVVGLVGYFGTGRVSVTALIPAFFGIPVLVCGGIALQEAPRKHAMHAAAALGLLATIGSGMRLVRAESFSLKTISLGAMFLLSVVFVILCVRSFVVARVLRK